MRFREIWVAVRPHSNQRTTLQDVYMFITVYLALLLTVFVKVAPQSVTITSSLQPGLDTVCINETLTLTCHSDEQVKVDITWYWSSQSQQGNSITVLATFSNIIYICVASDSNGTIGKANVTVVANGTPPKILKDNFYNYLYLHEGSSITLTTKITSHLQLSDGSPSWYGFHRNLPKSAQVENYTINGIIHSTIMLYDLSYYDDSGEYINSASNKCGTSTASVFIAVRRDPMQCFNYGVPSLVSPPTDYTTVVGEYASFSCLFNGSATVERPISPLTSYWVIDHGSTTTNITANSTNYHIAVYQTCSSVEHSCCQFISKLMVYNVTLMSNATVKCYEFFQQQQSNTLTVNANVKNYTTSGATLIVYDLPKVTIGPKDVTVKPSQSVKFTCEFKAPTLTGVSIVVWLKDDFYEIKSSSHYNISVHPSVMTSSKGEQDGDHFVSILTILSITDDDEGKYTCYCYYNTTLVTSTKHQYITSNLESANLKMAGGDDNNKESSTAIPLYASITAGTAVLISTIIIWIIGVIIFLRYRRRPQLVNLRDDCYESSDDEKQPLIEKHEQDNYKTNDKEAPEWHS